MPAMMATSATLKIPVRNGPMPTLRKSMTLPMAIRSTRFEIPPARNSSSPTAANLDHLIAGRHDQGAEQEGTVRRSETPRHEPPAARSRRR